MVMAMALVPRKPQCEKWIYTVMQLQSESLHRPPIVAHIGPICLHVLPKVVTFFTEVHGVGGCGGRHRRSPTGGRAYGMPRKAACFESGSIKPCTLPAFVAITGVLPVQSRVIFHIWQLNK